MVRMLENEGGVPSVLIEGNKHSLKCFANVILSVLEDEDCGYGVSPVGPGSAYFSPTSPMGVYIHRLPCVNELIGGKPPVQGNR